MNILFYSDYLSDIWNSVEYGQKDYGTSYNCNNQ